MIQFNQPTNPGFPFVVCTTSLDLYDKFDTSIGEYATLWKITNQFTGKSKIYNTSTSYANKDRYLEMGTVLTTGSDMLNQIKLGTKDFPLGFYDVIIYQNTANDNTDPDGLNVVYNGLMNLIASNNFVPVNTVDYTEYVTNDSDTESVYITL
tara:strand:- start:49 stop:504 length:456 start_codon:yes stop_codon:yes gene_type:complete